MPGAPLPDPIPDDPSEIGWPVALPLELAMGEGTPKEICQSYGISRSEWQVLIENEQFQRAVEEAMTDLEKDGAMFKAKLKVMAQGLLPRMWYLAHAPLDAVPAAVQKDLITFAVRAAGLDASVEQKAKAIGAGGQTNALQINIDLS
jgi:hypothetical protein